MSKSKSRNKLLIIVALLIIASVIAFAIIKLWPQERTTIESFNFDNIERQYLLHIPPSYDGTNLVPLVILVHGRTESPYFMEKSSGMSAISDAEGFIVVYPLGIGFSWNVGFGLGQAFENKVDDVGFIRELIDRLQQKYAIDRNRIYMGGHSNGAMLSYLVAAELSEKIAAICAQAGTIGGRATPFSPLITIPEPTQPVSIIVFHGLGDTVVPYNGGTGFEGRDYLSVNESVSFWVRHDGCSKEPRTEASEGIDKKTYGGGINGTEVVLYTLDTSDHEWPLRYSDTVWEFFKSHPKKG